MEDIICKKAFNYAKSEGTAISGTCDHVSIWEVKKAIIIAEEVSIKRAVKLYKDFCIYREDDNICSFYSKRTICRNTIPYIKNYIKKLTK